MPVTVIIALALTALVALFSLQNAQPVQVTLFSWYFQGSLVVVLLLAFAVGLVTTALLSAPGRFRRGRELAECRRRIRELEKTKAAAPPLGSNSLTAERRTGSGPVT